MKPGRARLRGLPKPPEERPAAAVPTAAAGTVSFRVLPAVPGKFPLTEAEKAEKWNDLMQRTDGGTIRLGGDEQLESDRL